MGQLAYRQLSPERPHHEQPPESAHTSVSATVSEHEKAEARAAVMEIRKLREKKEPIESRIFVLRQELARNAAEIKRLQDEETELRGEFEEVQEELGDIDRRIKKIADRI